MLLHVMNHPHLDVAVATSTKLPSVKAKPALLRYRVMIAYRFLLASFGGYALASLCAILIAQTFADYRASAAMAATLIAFTVQCAAFIWVFMVNKTLKASLGILLPSLVLFCIYTFLGN